jgi:RIO-like serine/threonine protein kinase
MNDLSLELDQPAKDVFTEIRRHKAMPALEIAAVTDIRGDELEQAIQTLADKKLVTLSKPTDLLGSIVSISGKYF